ncbi:MAG: acyl-CoA dehydrogenase family protein [Deltaproteobacteria bacterium]|nr:acyl-CoA dehydrogenase family protein [Deltaproteobacteria bacterium]
MKDSSRKDTQEQAAFREHCQRFLKIGIPKPPAFRLPQSALEIMTREQLDFLVVWQKKAYQAGLVGCDYPEEYGGGGRTDCQRIANEEMSKAPAYFFPNIVGLGMAGPAIYHHGTEVQKRRFLPKILSGEEIWCQGFSEPDAGSDLANVQTFGVKEGDNWVVNGQKIWTSLAQFAHWMILLCRHDTHEKYTGLTYFLAPMQPVSEKSVDVRPLIKMTGESGFNEVFLNDHIVPDAYRLDDVGKGWHVAMTTLLHERGAGGLVTPRSAGSGVEQSKVSQDSPQNLIGLSRKCALNGRRTCDDPLIRDRIMQLIIREKGLEQCARRARVKGLVDNELRIPLQAKVVSSELLQDTGALAMDIEGAAGSYYIADENAPEKGKWPLLHMNSYGMTIAAGTSEIQRNIIGERILGLPKSK